MQLNPDDPAVRIACNRLGISAEQLAEYPEDAFQSMSNAKARYAAHRRLLENNRQYVAAEVKRMAEKGVTIAEFQFAGSPEDFPYRILQGGSAPRVVSVVTPADSRKDRVIKMTEQKAERARQEILERQARSEQQVLRNRKQQERSQYICHEMGQRAKIVAYSARIRSADRQQLVAGHIKAKMERADEQIQLQANQLRNSNEERSRQLKVRVKAAYETAYGLSDYVKQAKQEELARLKRHMQEREAQREKTLDKVKNTVSTNCQRAKEKAVCGKQQIQQNNQRLADKVSEFEGRHDYLVEQQRAVSLQQASLKAQQFNQQHREKVAAAIEIKRAEKEGKVFENMTKTERANLNLEGNGSKLAQLQQLVRTRNECEEEKARLMKSRIKAKIAYKKAVYDYFDGNIPFTM